MRFATEDGQEYTGRSYDEIVAAMASDKLVEPKSLDSYRRATAKRIRSSFGILIPTDTSKHFVRHLVASGLLESR